MRPSTSTTALGCYSISFAVLTLSAWAKDAVDYVNPYVRLEHPFELVDRPSYQTHRQWWNRSQ